MLPDNDRDILRGIADCLDLVGRDGFAARLVALVERIGADQVMVFAYEADRARCLISRNFDERALGQHLAEDYLDGWFRQDPLFRLAMDLEEGHGRVVRLAMRSAGTSLCGRRRRARKETISTAFPLTAPCS